MDPNTVLTLLSGLVSALTLLVAAVLAGFGVLWKKLARCEARHDQAQARYEKAQGEIGALRLQNTNQEWRLKALEKASPPV